MTVRRCEHCDGPIPTHTPGGQRKQSYDRARFCSHPCRNEGQRGRPVEQVPKEGGALISSPAAATRPSGRIQALRRAHGIEV